MATEMAAEMAAEMATEQTGPTSRAPTNAAADAALDGALVDVLIVGAGTAGLPCAIAAVDAGARVRIIEKSDRIGGTLHLSGGHFSAAGTNRQRAYGIADDTVDAHFADVVRISEHTAREDIARKAVDLAPEMVDWLDANGAVTGWQPTGWVVSGGGTITSTGLFTAADSEGGPFSVIAYGGKYTNKNLYAPATPPSLTANWSTSGKAAVRY